VELDEPSFLLYELFVWNGFRDSALGIQVTTAYCDKLNAGRRILKTEYRAV